MSSTEGTSNGAGGLTAHLGLFGATALAVTVVVGSGALVLPGVAYAQAGHSAPVAWGAAAAITVPLLVVFARLGSRYPGAGGIAGFAQAGFGRTAAAGVEVTLLGTFGLGIPAIALTGGNYVVQALGAPQRTAPVAAIILLVGCGLVVTGGVRVSGRVQTVLAIILTAGLVAAAVIALATSSSQLQIEVPDSTTSLHTLAATVGTVFFAFTGWEMISFTTEEYRNPRRDFPRVLALSFVIVTVMYLLLAVGLEAQLAPSDPILSTSPIRGMVNNAVGAQGALLVTVLGVVIIAANLVGAIWGASRLVMSSAREGLLPSRLAKIDDDSSSPRQAVVACITVFVLVVLASGVGWLSLTTLLSVAGRNFFLLYLLCAVVYARLFSGWARVFGIAVIAVLSAVTVGFGPWSWVYAILLFAIGVVVHRGRSRHSDVSEVAHIVTSNS